MNELVFTLPDVGEGLAEAEVVAWLVEVGDDVRADQPVVTVETAKAQVELPAPADGVVSAIAAGPGTIVEVGNPLYTLSLHATPTSADKAPLMTEAAVRGDALAVPRKGRVLAAPSVRRLARELDVDLSALAGSGPHGRVTSDDVRAASGAERPRDEAGEGDSVVPLRGLRRQIASAMERSWTVPHVTEFREVDATELEATLRQLREDLGIRLSPLPLLVKMAVVALRRHPLLNATLSMPEQQYVLHSRQHIGIAAATADGLIVPVIHDAGAFSVEGLATEIGRLGEAARQRTLALHETSGATFTVSNFGSYGTWLGTPLINPPQVAIAGFGRIRDSVVAMDGLPMVRRTLPLAVSADHRLIDGDGLGAFVTTLERLITKPLTLLGEAD